MRPQYPEEFIKSFQFSLVKSVQLALTNLLTKSGLRGTFSQLSTMRGSISIIEWLPFRFFWASLGKVCHRDAIERTKTHNCVGIEKFQGDPAGGPS